MKKRQSGFGGLQIVVAVAAMAIVSMVAIPKYKASMNKAKLTEAFNLAGASKKKLTEFYMVNDRFPRSEAEANSMVTETFSPPEYVEKMAVVHDDPNHEVVIKVFIKPDLIEHPEPGGGEQYIYVAGNSSAAAGNKVVWSCGGEGMSTDLLPDECKS